MISYLGSLVQFSPAAGRVGHCRQMSLCGGSTRRVLAKQPAVLGPSPRVRRAFSLRGERPRWPEVCACPSRRHAFSLRGEWPGKPEAWRPLHGRAAPFPSAAPARAVGSRKSSDRNRGLCAGWEGVASLGLSLPLSPPPASYLQRGWGGSSLEFLSPFVLRTAGGVFPPVNFSLTLPQLKNLPPTALRAFWPVLTLSNAAPSSLFAPSCWWRVRASGGTFLLGVAFRHVICVPYLISPPS